MRRTLLISNDFPPRAGGIQSYVHELARRLPAGDLVVYASDWPGAAAFDAALPFPVVRHPTSLLLPTPGAARRAAALVREHGATAAWFGAAAPLALMTPALRQAGVRRVVASTHGHEVGWAMLPGARQGLRRIGAEADVVTFVSRYARHRISGALGPLAALEHLPAGVDTATFRPDAAARARLRTRWGVGDGPVIGCVSRLVRRKGQDTLLQALPAVLATHPDATLVLVGDGPDRGRLSASADAAGLRPHVVFTGAVASTDLPDHYAAFDVFAMPCRTRGAGLDVEGLGIVYLEAAAAGVPVVAGDSGGAPEAVRDGSTGVVVPGGDPAALSAAVTGLLDDPARRAAWGRAGREWVAAHWNWQRSADKLADLLTG